MFGRIVAFSFAFLLPCSAFFGQEVFVPRQATADSPAVKAEAKPPVAAPAAPVVVQASAKLSTPASPEQQQPAKEMPKLAVSTPPTEKASQPVAKPQAPEIAAVTKAPAVKKEIAAAPAPAAKPPVQLALPKAAPREPEPVSSLLARSSAGLSKSPQSSLPQQTQKVQEVAGVQPVNLGETASIKLANGFDFPVGRPDAEGYYKARGYRANGHLGDDWNGTKGGDTDLGDPIFSIGDGVVVFARDIHMGWGNVVIVRHAFREGGVVKQVDALYGHLQSVLVKKGQTVARGQKIATLGNAHGLYDAHLHLEIRKNIEIGISRAAFKRDFSNYYDPTQFIATHRNLQTGGAKYRVALNTFAKDRTINFDKKRNFSTYRGGTSESAAALKKAVAQQKSG